MKKRPGNVKVPVKNPPLLKKSELGLTGIDYPLFCFKHLQKGFDLSSCNDDEKKAFVNQIVNLAQLEWKKIDITPRKGMGYEQIPIEQIKPARPSFITPDVDHLLAFRFSGKKPFLALRNRCILHIIYIDTKYNVYDHE